METFYPRYWPFVRGIHRWPVNSLHKGQRRGALMFSFICTGINVWANNGEVGDLRRYRAHYYVLGMGKSYTGESTSSYRGLMQDCINSSALAMELLQSWAKPSIFKRPRYLLLRYKPMGSFWMNSTDLWLGLVWIPYIGIPIIKITQNTRMFLLTALGTCLFIHCLRPQPGSTTNHIWFRRSLNSIFSFSLVAGEIACTDNPTIYKAGTLPRCPEDTWIVPILLGIYIMFANVLMLNLLIAMFR